jgi:DNA-binding NarL/FixJ family response regulator
MLKETVSCDPSRATGDRSGWPERRKGGEMENKPKILVVDDEHRFAESLRATLEARTCEVTMVTSRVEAEQCIRAEKPDAIVLGTIMPRGEAFRLHQWIKGTASLNEVPMIVIDAPIEKQLLTGWKKGEGLLLEADDYLVKPVDPESVFPILDRLLDRRARKIKVLVADDHAIVRDGIRALLGVQKDMQVVGEAVDGKDALEKTRELAPDVVLMDVVMPGMNGLEATKHIAKEFEKTKVLMLSQYDDEENVLASTRAGAYGFIPKKSASTDLLSAIRSI